MHFFMESHHRTQILLLHSFIVIGSLHRLSRPWALEVDSGMTFPLVLLVAGPSFHSRFFREFRVHFEMNG